MPSFAHRIVFVGFGAVARCTLPILLHLANVDPRRITIMEFDPTTRPAATVDRTRCDTSSKTA